MPKKGVLFDLDGTLVETWKTNILPGVQEVITALKAANIKIGVCTNQAGPLWRLVTGDEKYPTVEKFAVNLFTIAFDFGLIGNFTCNSKWYISVSDPKAMEKDPNALYMALDVKHDIQKSLWKKNMFNFHIDERVAWRKPNPDMLIYARQDMQVQPQECIYVGDMDSDLKAASNAGIDFLWARDIGTLPQVVKGDTKR